MTIPVECIGEIVEYVNSTKKFFNVYVISQHVKWFFDLEHPGATRNIYFVMKTIPLCNVKYVINLELVKTHLEYALLFQNVIEINCKSEIFNTIQMKKPILSDNNLFLLRKLKVLNLSHNEISKLEGLEKLVQLKELDLSNNWLKKIEGLENLLQLERLDLSHNEISKLEGLEKLVQLKELDLSHNEIDELYMLELQGFNTNEPIRKIDNLKNLTNLKILYIEDVMPDLEYVPL